MSKYNSRDNPCFDGNCQVRMEDGSVKNVQDIKKGDKVMSGLGHECEIICVIKTICKNS